MIYLDNSATTKPCKEAVEAVMDGDLDGFIKEYLMQTGGAESV